MADSAARALEPMTVAQFLAFCDGQTSPERWELIDGVPVMMTGGTAGHSLLIGNVFRALDPAARQRGCRAMTSYLARVSDENAFEPDVLVQCGPIEREHRHTGDPVIVVEVLSRSTLRKDRVLKFEHYRTLEALQQIVFVYQDSVRVESWLRQQGDWMNEPLLLLTPEDQLAFPVLGASAVLADIYDGLRPSPITDM
jgi:Uma2 family endonuclease